MSTECTPGCKARQEALRQWIERYPDYCKHCDAAGIIHDRGDMYQPPSDDPCQCIESDTCPRCKQPFNSPGEAWEDDSYYPVCPSCGWDSKLVWRPALTPEEAEAARDMTAPVVDCYCWEVDYDDYREERLIP